MATSEPTQPGSSVDRQRLNYLHLDPPRKGSGTFNEWIDKFRLWVDDMERIRQRMIYTDEGFYKERKWDTLY